MIYFIILLFQYEIDLTSQNLFLDSLSQDRNRN